MIHYFRCMQYSLFRRVGHFFIGVPCRTAPCKTAKLGGKVKISGQKLFRCCVTMISSNKYSKYICTALFRSGTLSSRRTWRKNPNVFRVILLPELIFCKRFIKCTRKVYPCVVFLFLQTFHKLPLGFCF